MQRAYSVLNNKRLNTKEGTKDMVDQAHIHTNQIDIVIGFLGNFYLRPSKYCRILITRPPWDSYHV